MSWWNTRRRRETALRAVETAAAYARWAPHYPPRAHNRLMEVEERAVRELLPPLAGVRALDLACGTGRYLAHLADGGAGFALGIDRSAAMLASAWAGARLVRADLYALPLADAVVDLVTCGLAFMDVACLDAAVAEIARVLRPGGSVVYSTLHPDGRAAGWVRTFEDAGVQYALPTCWHSMDEHLAACAMAGLVVDARREPLLDADGRSGPPAALVIRARKSEPVAHVSSDQGILGRRVSPGGVSTCTGHYARPDGPVGA